MQPKCSAEGMQQVLPLSSRLLHLSWDYIRQISLEKQTMRQLYFNPPQDSIKMIQLNQKAKKTSHFDQVM